MCPRHMRAMEEDVKQQTRGGAFSDSPSPPCKPPFCAQGCRTSKGSTRAFSLQFHFQPSEEQSGRPPAFCYVVGHCSPWAVLIPRRGEC